MADYYADLAINDFDNDFFNGYHEDEIWKNYQKEKLKWTTKDKQEIPIKKIEDSHLLNLIEFLKKKKSSNTALNEWIDVFNAEALKRKLIDEI